MTKKNALILVGSILFFQAATAQVETNSRLLRQAAVDFKLKFESNYAKAMQLAKARNWPLSYKTKEGQKAILVGVDDFNQPKYYVGYNNTIAAATTRTNQLWPGGRTGFNLTGGSDNLKNKIGIWDAGTILSSHVELTGRVTIKDNPTSDDNDHATHVAGTLIAQGVNPSAKGMSFGAKGLVAYDLLNDESEMFNEASNLLLSNHSYGLVCGWNYNSSQSRWEFYGEPDATEDYRFGYYNSEAQNIDSIAYNAPFYLIVKAAGNNRSSNGPAVGQTYYRRNAQGQMVASGTRPSGISNNDSYDIIPADNGAKNVLTVGAVPGIPAGYSRPEDVALTTFSSWGPTDDGRIKPDVVADGVAVLSSIATGNSSYASLSGTSMATPNTTGSLLLLQELYSKLKGATSFLRSATIRGLAIHTASEAGPSPGPDYRFGWGLLNVEKAATVINSAVTGNNGATSPHLLFENTLAQGQTYTTTVVASGNGPLTATICWTDVKGAVDLTNRLNNRNKKLVNDLDIRITKGTGQGQVTYLPWTLDVANPANPAAPGDNITDNVERIDIDTAVVPGTTYTITVTHKGTLVRGPQAYTLLVSGVGSAAYCTSAPTSNTGARIENVTFRTINVTNPAGNTTYTDNTRFTSNIEPSQTSAINVKVGSSDGTDVPKMVKVFIDYNNNGVFETGELAAVSTATLLNNATFTANIATPASLVIGNVLLMRVIVQETNNAANINACGSYTKGETQDYRLRVVNPTNDVSISAIVSPQSGDCASGAQYVTVAIANNGSVAQSNIPLTLTIAPSSGGAGTTLSATYPGTIAPLSSVNYTFQTPVVVAAATTYGLTVTTNLAIDQFSGNNQLNGIVTTAANPAAPSAIASICAGTANLKVNNTDGSNYYWYTSATGGTPVAKGSPASTTTIPGNKTFYVAPEIQTSVGPLNKSVYSQGGYNAFNGNYIKFNNAVPLVIQTARLYVNYPGKIKFTVGNLTNEDADGSYSYQIISSTIVDAYATSTNPAPGAVTGNNASDTGNVFLLNLPVIPTGDHIINIILLNADGSELTTGANGASLFRNNGITGTGTYPTTLQNVMQFTGNSAHTGGAQESQFYYFFYDTRVVTGCGTDRVAVVATDAPTPTISLVGDSLVSSASSGNQWYINDTAINGAGGVKYKPTRNGIYKVTVTDAFGCQKTSSTINYVLTAIDPVAAAREINLMVNPNPNNGVFNVSFEVSTRADLSIELLGALGQRVFSESRSGFTGRYTKQLAVSAASGVYMLRISHGKKNYVQKVIIQ